MQNCIKAFFRVSGSLALLPSLSLSSLSFAGTSENPSQGEVVKAWGGDVWSAATLDEAGKVETLSLYISMDSIKGVPPMDMESYIIPLPEIAREQTFFDHVSLDWNPHGHEPVGIYTKPHFDIHYYHPSIKGVAAIDCSDSSFISPELVPSGYALPPQLAAPGACVPGMGFHASPITDFAPTYSFEETFIYGYYQAELTFFEPMITQEFFLAKKEANRTLPNPASFGFLPYRFPLDYSVRFDEKRGLYELKFSDFQGHQAIDGQ